MFNTTTLDFLPLWIIFLGSVILIVIAIEIGFYLGRRRLARMKDGEPPHIGGAVAATLGLLAFMLAFTFGTGSSRWDAKKELVLAESNAVATAFLRADLIPEPYRSEVQRLLSEYVDHRINAVQHSQSSILPPGKAPDYAENMVEHIGQAKAFHSELWSISNEVASSNPTPLTALFISALNEVFDIHQERVTIGVQQRLPLVFWTTLYCLAFLAMGLTGDDAGVSRSARSLSAWVVAIAFSTVILLVVALDRPQISVVNQMPLLELQQDMHNTIGSD